MHYWPVWRSCVVAWQPTAEVSFGTSKPIGSHRSAASRDGAASLRFCAQHMACSAIFPLVTQIERVQFLDEDLKTRQIWPNWPRAEPYEWWIAHGRPDGGCAGCRAARSVVMFI